MSTEIKKMLNEEIEGVLESISDMSPDGDDYTARLKNLKILHEIKTEAEKAEIEDAKLGLDEIEIENKRLTDRIAEYGKIGVNVLGIVLPLAFYGVWMKRGFRFEETGTFTSATFKGLSNKFRPTVK